MRRVIPRLKTKPFQYPTIQVLNPGKGLNNLISDNLIDDKEASDLSNIMFSEGGAPGKSWGKATWGTGIANNPRGLGSFNITNGSHYLVTVDGTALKQTTTKTDAWTSIGGATFDASHDVTFTQARNKLFIWDGTNGGAWWDGTTLSRPGTMPSAAFSINYQGLHIASGTTTNNSRLYVSKSRDATAFTRSSWTTPGSPPTLFPDNPTDVPGSTAAGPAPGTSEVDAQYIDIQKDDGDKITGLARFNTALIIFKERSIYQLVFDSSGAPTVTPVINYLGAVSHKSIDNVENEIYYLSRLGWFVLGYQQNFYNVIRSNELSVRVHPIIETLNASQLARVASIYKPYVYFSSYPTGSSTTNTGSVNYDKRYDAWSKMSTIHANYFSLFVDSNNVEHLLFASDDEAQVYEITANTFTDNGSAIDAYWVSKAFDGGKPDLYKRWIDATLLFRQISGTITVTFYADNNQLVKTSTVSSGISAEGIGYELIGNNLIGGTPDPNFTLTDTTATVNVPYRFRISQKSRTLKVKIENANNNETFVLLGIMLTYRPYSHFVYPSSLKIQ